MSIDNDHTELERSLRESAPAGPADWSSIRSGLAGEAERAGLIDVAFERHETPLGTILVGATR